MMKNTNERKMALRIKTNNHILMLVLGTFVILLSVFLSVGVTYSRYVTQITGDKGYSAQLATVPSLVDFDENGEKCEFVPNWQLKGGEQYLTLTVSNQSVESESFPNSDMSFRIRIFVPESLYGDEDGTDGVSIGNLTMTLQADDSSVIYYSKADYLSTQTPLYTKNGENGWFFSFFATFESEDGQTFEEEASYLLNGGQISDVSLTLTVQDTNIDCSGFRILVDRI